MSPGSNSRACWAPDPVFPVSGRREGGAHPALQAEGNAQAEGHSQLPGTSGDRTEGTRGDVILWKQVGPVFARSEFLWTEGQGWGKSHSKSWGGRGCLDLGGHSPGVLARASLEHLSVTQSPHSMASLVTVLPSREHVLPRRGLGCRYFLRPPPILPPFRPRFHRPTSRPWAEAPASVTFPHLAQRHAHSQEWSPCRSGWGETALISTTSTREPR